MSSHNSPVKRVSPVSRVRGSSLNPLFRVSNVPHRQPKENQTLLIDCFSESRHRKRRSWLSCVANHFACITHMPTHGGASAFVQRFVHHLRQSPSSSDPGESIAVVSSPLQVYVLFFFFGVCMCAIHVSPSFYLVCWVDLCLVGPGNVGL